MTFVLVGALALLPLSMFLSEAVMWFARNALDIHRSDDDDASAADLARSASQAELVSRFCIAVSFVALISIAVRLDSIGTTLTVVLAAFVWTLFAGALSGVHWRSPVSLA